MKPLGVVVCGGKSTRMGSDKSQLVYHGVPQHLYLSDLLAPLCEQVAISCNAKQYHTLETPFKKVPDLPELGDHGPISAVLTCFRAFPDHDLLVVGCDYPFIDAKELALFLSSVKRDSLAAAFYNSQGKYEPLLAWYSRNAAPLLHTFFESKQYSLQHFLHQINAEKYIPESKNSMTSVDTPEDFRKTLAALSFDKK